MNGFWLFNAMLASTSVIMTATLWLAWRMFDRPRHALSWTWAFLCGCMQSVLSGVAVTLAPGPAFVTMSVGSFWAAMMSLVLLGARQRAGVPPHGGWLAGGLLVFTALLGVTCFAVSGPAASRVVINIYAATLLLLAARHVRLGGRAANPSELALVWVLRLVAGYCLALAAVMVIGGEPARLYPQMIGLALPSLGVALGVALSFVMAGDVNERLHALVTRDPLTGVLNRRGLEEAAQAALAGARRHRRPLTLVMADLDRFKAINDAGGHAAGDRALCRFAEVAQQTIRGDDLLARLGGDEFCLLLSGAAPETAIRAVERIQTALQGEITASFGIAMLDGGEALDALIARADQALYRAKAEGRDRALLAVA